MVALVSKKMKILFPTTTRTTIEMFIHQMMKQLLHQIVNNKNNLIVQPPNKILNNHNLINHLLKKSKYLKTSPTNLQSNFFNLLKMHQNQHYLVLFLH